MCDRKSSDLRRMTTQIVQQKLIPQGVILTLAMYNSLQSRRCTFDEANFLQSCPSSIPHYPSSYQLTGHTKRRRDAGTDDGTAGEVIKTTCSCPVLIVKDDGTDDGLTFRHCCASHAGRWPVRRTVLLPDGIPWPVPSNDGYSCLTY